LTNYPIKNLSKISVVTPCYNEKINITLLYRRTKDVFAVLPYTYEHIFVDNDSDYESKKILRDLAKTDPNVKIIFNLRNYGFVRSSTYALFQGNGDATIFLMCDLQDPPEVIPYLIEKYISSDADVVFAVRESSNENSILFAIKKIYYKALDSISSVQLVRNSTGFGIYSHNSIELLQRYSDSQPFIKGLVSELGLRWQSIPYISQDRQHGTSSARLTFLIDFGVLGITSHSRVPLRLITYAGFTLSFLSLILGILVVISKIFYDGSFPYGVAMLSSGFFFLMGFQIFATGLIGEYVGFLNERSMNRPLVIERERLNF
jgi:glycosyltransferase involved in cell wall biosynthesis